MLLDAYEFLKELKSRIQIPQTSAKRHNITLNKDGNLCLGVWYKEKIYEFVLTYNEFKNGNRKDTILKIINIIKEKMN